MPFSAKLSVAILCLSPTGAYLQPLNSKGVPSKRSLHTQDGSSSINLSNNLVKFPTQTDNYENIKYLS